MTSKLAIAGAFLGGLLLGMLLNMLLVRFGPLLIPPPVGVDVTNLESLRQGITLFQPYHFIVPFLAHALGTLCGAYVAARLYPRHRRPLAFAVGAVSLLGGIVNATMLPLPTWFLVLDLSAAYLPMSALAVWLTPTSTA